MDMQRLQEQGRKLERLAGIQFPEYYSRLDPDTIISQPECLVNMRRSEVENGHAAYLAHVQAEMSGGLDGPGGSAPNLSGPMR